MDLATDKAFIPDCLLVWVPARVCWLKALLPELEWIWGGAWMHKEVAVNVVFENLI